MMMMEKLSENNNGFGGKIHHPFPANDSYNGNGGNIGCRLTRLLRRRYDPSKLHQWSVVVEREKPLTVNFQNAPQNRLRITQAKLCSNSCFESERNDLFCKVGDMPQILLCCIRKNHDQEKAELDFEFGGPDDVEFSVNGPHKLCLVGYYFDGPPPPTLIFSQTIGPNGSPVVSRASGEQSSLKLTLIDDDSLIAVSKNARLGNSDMHTKAVDEATQLPEISGGATKELTLCIECHPSSNDKLPAICVGAPKQPPLCIEWHPNSNNPVNSTHSNGKLLKIDTVNAIHVDGSMNQTILEGSKADETVKSTDTQIVKFAVPGENLERYTGLLGSKRKRNNEDLLAEGLQGTDAIMEKKMDLLAQNKRAKYSAAGNDFDIVHPERTSCIVDDNMSSTGVPQRLDGQKLNPRNQRKRAKMTFACPYYKKVKRGRRAPCFNVNGGLPVANDNERSTGKLKPSLERQLLRYKPRPGLFAGRSICSNFWARLRRICGMK